MHFAFCVTAVNKRFAWAVLDACSTITTRAKSSVIEPRNCWYAFHDLALELSEIRCAFKFRYLHSFLLRAVRVLN